MAFHVFLFDHYDPSVKTMNHELQVRQFAGLSLGYDMNDVWNVTYTSGRGRDFF